MQEKSLYWIDPPDDSRPPKVVGRQILSLYRQEFSLTTSRVCKILRCERHWVQMTLKPLIRHISVSQYFRQYIMEQFELSERELSDFSHSSNFYSTKALDAYWRANASAEQKYRVIDLADYIDQGSTVNELLDEFSSYAHTKRSKLSKELHFERMREILTSEGFRLYTASKFRKAAWEPVDLPVLPIERHELPLMTTAEVMHRQGLNSDTAAILWLNNHGAIRIKLMGKTLWSVHETIGRWPIAVPLNDG